MKRGNPHTIKGKGFDAHPENIGGGRPKGVKNRATILRKWIETRTKIVDPGTGETVDGTMEDKVYLALLSKALGEDVAAIKEINDTLYGKIADKTEVKTEGNITINLIKGARRSN